MALAAGKLGILRIDVHEIVTFRIHLIEFFAADRADSGRAARRSVLGADDRTDLPGPLKAGTCRA